MKNVVALCLVVILIIGLAGAVLAKGEQGKQGGTQYSPPPSGQEDQSEDPGNNPDQSQPNRSQDRNRHEQRSEEEQAGETEPQTATEQFRERLMEQLRLHQAEQCEKADRSSQNEETWSGDMEGLAYHAEQRRFTPEETAELFVALGHTAKSGASKRISEAIAAVGIDAGRSPAQIRKTLQSMERLHQEFRCRILSGEDQEDEDRLMELARNVFKLRQNEHVEEQLREHLRDGWSLEDAVNQLLP